MPYGFPYDEMDEVDARIDEAAADEDRAQAIADRFADHAPATALGWEHPPVRTTTKGATR